MSEELLRIENLDKFFDVRKKGVLKAVNNVSLTINKGETVGLVGESGCGKSTLGRCIVKLYKPNAGHIYYRGQDIWQMSKEEQKEYRQKVQIVYQDPYASLDPLMVINDSVAEGIDIHKLAQKENRNSMVTRLLEMVGLNHEHANRFPHEFSGGQRQRIGISRALSLNPELVICDEPISALDVSIQAQVVNLLMRLQKERGLAYLFITHDLAMVKAISNRIVVMYLGTIMETAPSVTLYRNHMHPYTNALLSAIPIPDPEVERKRQRILLEGDVPSPINVGPECRFCKRCPYATEICFKEAPQLEEVGKDHYVACHHKGEIKA
ncbi:MAG: ABC transporter ATP-binding protein [Firmicutes bacterium]|nr:ABC transporter ATP-binding protein [Bacillota bacterium]MBQ6663477.1 ABC transporter ATP-binding protein [Bacillota bacterium]